MRTSPLIASAVALVFGLVLFASPGTAQARVDAADATAERLLVDYPGPHPASVALVASARPASRR
jgi:hypothetical protein